MIKALSNPFGYYKTPNTRAEAQSNVNYWWYEGMGECPSDAVEAGWDTYIKEMKREAARCLKIIVDKSAKTV
jgi:hypothetical protein